MGVVQGRALENHQWAACGLTPLPPLTLDPSSPPTTPEAPQGAGIRPLLYGTWGHSERWLPVHTLDAADLPDPRVYLCALTCVCMCVSVCMHVYTHVCVRVDVCAHVYMCLHEILCVHTPIQACPCCVYG